MTVFELEHGLGSIRDGERAVREHDAKFRLALVGTPRRAQRARIRSATRLRSRRM